MMLKKEKILTISIKTMLFELILRNLLIEEQIFDNVFARIRNTYNFLLVFFFSLCILYRNLEFKFFSIFIFL